MFCTARSSIPPAIRDAPNHGFRSIPPVLRSPFQSDIGVDEVTNMRMIFNLAIATVTFLTFFYSATVALSLMYALDSALLKF
jgi:hypothetical protein